MATPSPPDAILTEVLPRDAASLGRGYVRTVLIGLGVILGFIATVLGMMFVGNGMLTIEAVSASAVVFLVFATVPVLFVGPLVLLVSLWHMNDLFPRSTTIVGDQVTIAWPRKSVCHRLADCKWSAGRSSWEWLGLYMRSHPTTLLIAPTGDAYMLGTDQATAAQHAAVLKDLGVEQVTYVSPAQHVFRWANLVVGGIGLGWVFGAALGAVVGFAIGDADLYRSFAAYGMMAGIVIAVLRIGKGGKTAF